MKHCFNAETILSSQAGDVCYVRLHQPEAAQVALSNALTLLHPLPARRRSTILTDLATTYVQQGEIERVCQLASQATTITAEIKSLAVQATTITAEIKSLAVLQRLRRLRQELEPWNAVPVVRDFDDQMAVLLTRINSREVL